MYVHVHMLLKLHPCSPNKLPKLAGRRPEVLTGSSQMNATRVTYFESRQIDFLSSYGLTYLLQRGVSQEPERKIELDEKDGQSVHVVRCART